MKHVTLIGAAALGIIVVIASSPVMAQAEMPTVENSSMIPHRTAGGIDPNNAAYNEKFPGSNRAMPDNMPTPNQADWNSEDLYWHDHYRSMPYYNRHMGYSNYEPAYQYGYNAYNAYDGEPWENLDQAKLRTDWYRVRGNSTLTWNQAQAAVHDAYVRMYDNCESPTIYND